MGNKSGGSEHILDKHVGEGKSFATEEDAFTEIDLIIKTGEIDFENGDKVVFKSENKLVTVRKNWRENGKKIADKNWGLTAYDEKSADSESPVATNKSLAGSATDKSHSKDTIIPPTTNELGEKSDVSSVQGDIEGFEGYSREVANNGNSGTHGLAAVVVTKNNESPANSKTSGLGLPISNHKGMENAPVANVDANVAKNIERAKRLD